jgi:hypothetical protein
MYYTRPARKNHECAGHRILMWKLVKSKYIFRNTTLNYTQFLYALFEDTLYSLLTYCGLHIISQQDKTDLGFRHCDGLAKTRTVLPIYVKQSMWYIVKDTSFIILGESFVKTSIAQPHIILTRWSALQIFSVLLWYEYTEIY